MSLNTPLVFVIFNRPHTTKRVWERIQCAKPRHLYIISDAPRPDKPSDIELVKQTRQIVEKINWPCKVIRDYAVENQGDFQRFESGLNLVFNDHDSMIFLEDDCLPDPSFFGFCENLLTRYAGHEKIGYINGSNLNWGLTKHLSDYYTSRYMFSWGHAMWKSSWKLFKSDLFYWKNPDFKSKVLNYFPDLPYKNALSPFPAISERMFWTQLFNHYDEFYEKPGSIVRKSGFDYYVKLALWAHEKWAITPSVNLIENIGFGAFATHTDLVNKSHMVPAKSLDIQHLRHPKSLELDEACEDWTYRVYALYEEARPFQRWVNATRLKLGRFREKIKNCI